MIVEIEAGKTEGSIIIHLQEDDEDPIVDEKDWLELGFRIGKAAEGANIEGVGWLEYDTIRKYADQPYLATQYAITIEDLTQIINGQLPAPWLH